MTADPTRTPEPGKSPPRWLPEIEASHRGRRFLGTPWHASLPVRPEAP